jgi:hypothetical protein
MLSCRDLFLAEFSWIVEREREKERERERERM